MIRNLDKNEIAFVSAGFGGKQIAGAVIVCLLAPGAVEKIKNVMVKLWGLSKDLFQFSHEKKLVCRIYTQGVSACRYE
jgi:hypothetical protein